MALDIVKVYITETVFGTAGAVPEPTGLTAVAVRQGVRFSWDWIPTLETDPIAPYYWQIRYNVEAAGWGAWRNIYGDHDIRELTAAEKAAYADDLADLASIKAELRITDGHGNYSVATLVHTLEALRDDVANADITDDGVTTADIGDDQVTTAKIADANVTLAKMAANSVDSDQYVDGSIDTVHIDDLQITTDKLDALAVTEPKIADDAVPTRCIVDLNVTEGKLAALSVTEGKIGALAVALSKCKADVTERLFNAANDATALETALGIALAALDPLDEILIAGPNTNIDAGNRAAIKTALAIEATSNKNDQTLVTDGLTAAGLTIGNLFEAANVVATVNANPGAGINNAAIANVYGTKVWDGVGANPLFNASGYQVFGGIRDIVAAAERTVAAIVASMDVNGNSLLWDPTSWMAGRTTADIPGGNIHATRQFVTAAEKVGAANAAAALTADPYLTASISDGVNQVTAAQVVAMVTGYGRTLWADESHAAFPAVPTVLISAVTCAAAWSNARVRWSYTHRLNDSLIKYTGEGKSSTGTAEFRIRIEDMAAVTILTGTGEVCNNAGWQQESCEVAISLGDLNVDETYAIFMDVMDAGLGDISIRGGTIEVTVEG